MRSRFVQIFAVLLLLCSFAFAQFDSGESARIKEIWEQVRLNPNTRVKLDFKNASIDMVIAFLSRASGVTIVKDPNLKTTVTVTSAGPIPLKDAFSIFKTVLGFQNYEMVKEGNIIVVRQKRPPQPPPMQMTPEQLAAMANAQNGELKFYEIKYANAAAVARVINEAFANSFARNNDFGFVFFGGGQSNRNSREVTVRASSEDYSNTVIVLAPPPVHNQIQELIKAIDKPVEDPEVSKVYKLVYAAADDLAPVIQNVLTQNAPRGKGGIGGTNVPFEQRFQQALRFGSTQASFGTVTADTRTNSLVVTGTEENHKIVAKLLEDLDKPDTLMSTTTVIPLENARADQIAELLNQAFDSPALNRLNNRNNQQNQNPFQNQQNPFANNNSGGSSSLGGGTGRAVNELPLEMQDPNATSGELKTEIGANSDLMAQFFGGFGGFGRQGGGRNNGRNNNNNNNQTGPARDAQGRVVNVRDLTGQVTAIPDMNTNSIIVVATPENVELVREIVLQLDKIPDQVMIETIIVEASLTAEDKLGVEWKFLPEKLFGSESASGQGNTNFGIQTGSTTAQGLRYTITGANFEAFLNALKTDTRFNVLSTPRIFTANNHQAQINISQRIPFVVSQRTDANGNITFDYNFEDVGIILTVIPRITANGTVTLDVQQTASELERFTDFNAPIVNQRQAQTSVSVKDGETMILGGIIRSSITSTVNKIPILGDIPILGNLFKSTDRTKAKTELLVFLTPHIVKSPDDARKLRDQQMKDLSPETRKQIDGAIGSAGGTATGNGGKG